jgi:hypothetical protein
MDTVLKDLLGTVCCIYIDDIVVFYSTAGEHTRRLENVLQRFDRANIQLHPGKCVFAQPQFQYLSFVLFQKGIAPSPEKLKAVKQRLSPKCVNEDQPLCRAGVTMSHTARIFWKFITAQQNGNL